MPIGSKIVWAVLLSSSFAFGSALSDGAVAKDRHKLCGNSGLSKAQDCGKQVVKAKVKKPVPESGKGISPGAALLLQLLF